MRVVHLTQSTTAEVTGGLEYHIAYLSDALRRRGHDIRVVSVGEVLIVDPPAPRVMALKHFIEFLATRKLPFLPAVLRPVCTVLLETATMFGRRLFKASYTPKIVRHIENLEPDLVHQHSYLGSLETCWLLSRKFPVVFTNHTGAYLHLDRMAITRPLQRQLMKFFTMIISPSHELLPATPNSRYVANGVDTHAFHPVSKSERDHLKSKHGCSGKKVFLCPRRWAPTKGVLYLARALRLLNDESRRNAVFLFAGNQTHGYHHYQADVRQALAEATGCDVRILGNLGPAALAELMNISEACIVPSLMEATSLACLEAMACGTPVVGTETGGLLELIQHGQNGWLLPMRDTPALASIVEKVVSMPQEELQRMRKSANESVRERYTWEVTARETEDVYQQALQKWKARRDRHLT